MARSGQSDNPSTQSSTLVEKEAWITVSLKAVTVEIVEVTPDMAEVWLTKNPNNRNIRKAVANAYSRDMAAGNWLLNGETVKFDTNGDLRDGQHRLLGVIAAGVTVPMVIVRGLDPDVIRTVDAGTKRTYADVLKMSGEDNVATLAAVTRRALLWHRGYRVKIGSVYPTALEMSEFLDDQPSLRTAAEVANKLAPRSLMPASLIGVSYWLLADLDPDTAMYVLSRVADGDLLAADDPIAVYRERLVKMRMGGNRVNETEALALLVNAWNAHRGGERRTKLQLPKGGLTNDNYPLPR